MRKDKDPFQVRASNFGGEKLVAGYVPQHIADYISLASYYEGVTVSSIVRRLIDSYIQAQDSEQYLVKVLANRAYNEFLKRYEARKKQMSWRPAAVPERYEEFKEEMERSIKRRSFMSDQKAEEIVAQMDLLYNPNDFL